MESIDRVREQVRSRLHYDYPGDPDDGDGSIDRLWINKNQKYEVDYAIAKCLLDCNAAYLATNTALIRRLEMIIQKMNSDGIGRCKRSEAYGKLKVIIMLQTS